MSFIHGNRVDWVSAVWDSAWPHWPTASQLQTKSTQGLWIALGFSWWFYPQKKMAPVFSELESLHWIFLKECFVPVAEIVCCDLWAKKMSLASWNQCYFCNTDDYVVRVHSWEDARILYEDSFSFHSSFLHSGSELGWALLLPTRIWIFWLGKERKKVRGHLGVGKAHDWWCPEVFQQLPPQPVTCSPTHSYSLVTAGTEHACSLWAHARIPAGLSGAFQNCSFVSTQWAPPEI